MKFYYWILSKIYQKAAKRVCQDCSDFIQKGSKILDLGCGSGIISKTFQDFFQAKVIGVDIKDTRITNIPFKIIDGKSLPFPDNEFDVTLISYVLHHAQDPQSLIAEAKRVSKRIIIYEDLAEEGKLAKFFCKIHLATFNLFFQSQNPAKYHFKTEAGWERFFREMGLKVVFKKRVIHAPLSRLKLGKRMLFVLEKNMDTEFSG